MEEYRPAKRIEWHDADVIVTLEDDESGWAGDDDNELADIFERHGEDLSELLRMVLRPLVCHMSFSSWLQNELNKRGFSQSDLVRSSKSAGYQISSMQISRVLNQDRGAGPDTCIAIAHGLGIPREEVFRARGWLLREPQEVVPQKASPKATAVIRGLTELSLERQEVVSEALLAQLSVVAQIIQETGFDNF